MILGIIGAMSEELEILLKDMKLEEKKTVGNMTFNKGVLWNQEVVAVVCGIGKEIYPGDVVIGDSLVEHDMDCSVFGDALGQVPRMDTFDFKADKELVELAQKACEKVGGFKTYTGRIVSGDQFIASVDKIHWLEDNFKALSCEMEGASIAHACYVNNIPFVVIRSISDNANNGAHMDFEKFTPIAVKNSTTILKEMILSM